MARSIQITVYAYLDASYSPTSGVSGVAGYVADEANWSAVLARWQDALLDWKLSTFHFAELPQIKGHTNAKICASSFENIIKQSELDAISASVFLEDWHRLDWGKDDSPRFCTHYEQALYFALICLGEHCFENFPEQDICVVCDADGSEGTIRSVFLAAQQKFASLTDIQIGRSANYLALQIADLGAGKIRLSWASILADENSEVPWGEMPKGRFHRASVWSLQQGWLLSRSFNVQRLQNTA